jgi:uncharacterized iron-regulated membrane protein
MVVLSVDVDRGNFSGLASVYIVMKMERSTVTSSPGSVVIAHDKGAAASRRWRSLWRLHFYSGIFAMPFIVLMAVTGLVILYTQPIQSLLDGEKRSVTSGTVAMPYEIQAKAAQAVFPKAVVTGVVTPRNATTATVFSVDDGSKAGQEVFVNPYTAKVLGTEKPGCGIIGLANRFHGFLNLSAITVSLPSIAALFDGGNIMRPYVVTDMVLEILGVWTLVLVMSGLYLWWPRRSRSAVASRISSAAGGNAPTNGGHSSPGSRRRLFGIRFKKTGRAKWRDLHGFSGVLLLGAMGVTIISGLAWSSYWGPNFAALANKVTPNSWTNAPTSALGKVGDLDTLGNRIPWNTGDRPIPASYATKADGSLPTPLGLDVVADKAKAQGMKPGFKINFPKNVAYSKTKAVTYGTFTVSNSWPRKTNEARDLHLNQFSGQTLAEQTGYGYGAVSYTLDSLVSTHMGTQFGLVSRIAMTALCVLSIWSVISALVMFTRRRRPGTVGLPRRPVDVKLAKRIGVTAIVMSVVFPLWGACAALILSIDRWVIRRNVRLRAAFGQR